MRRYLLTLVVAVSLGLVAAPALYAHGTHGVDVDLAIDPDSAAPGETVTASGSVANTSTYAELVQVALTVTYNGRTYPLGARKLRMRPGEVISLEVPFTVPSRVRGGEYVFTLRGWITRRPVAYDEASAILTVLPPP